MTNERANNPKEAQEQFTASGELRSFVENDLSKENDVVYPHLGLVPSDGEGMELLNFMQNVYEPQSPSMPHSFDNTKAGETMTKAAATKEGTRAVKEGNISQMKYITGHQDYDNDISGIHTLMELEDYLSRDAYIAYLFGHMGNGKTDFAILNAEIYKERFDGEVASNIKSFGEKDFFVQTYGDLLQWLANGHKVESIDEITEMDIEVGNKLFIFDEASSHASGYSDDAYETQQKLGTLTKKIRKVGGNMIIIGHTGKDVHPDIRRICNHCIDKIGKKNAVYYQTVNDEGNGVGDIFTVDQIPKTNYQSYDTEEITYWDWSEISSDDEQQLAEKANDQHESKHRRKYEMATMYLTNEDMTQKQVAEQFDVSRERISQVVKEFRDKAQDGVIA